jgi:hypothetical protein
MRTERSRFMFVVGSSGVGDAEGGVIVTGAGSSSGRLSPSSVSMPMSCRDCIVCKILGSLSPP